jgi:hypothetical protein
MQPTGRVKRWSACGNVARVLVWIKLTEATAAEAVEQTEAPITLPVRTDRAIFGVPVAAYLHRSGALRKHTKRDTRRTIELSQSIGKLSKDTHLRLGDDSLFDIGHGRTESNLTQRSRIVTPFRVLFIRNRSLLQFGKSPPTMSS